MRPSKSCTEDARFAIWPMALKCLDIATRWSSGICHVAQMRPRRASGVCPSGYWHVSNAIWYEFANTGCRSLLVPVVRPCSGAHRAGTYLAVLGCTITVTPTSILIIATTIIHVINILRLLILLLNYYSCYRYYYYHCRGGDPNIPAMGGTPAREAPRHKGGGISIPAFLPYAVRTPQGMPTTAASEVAIYTVNQV